jgi:HAE1 family hydrophobic/amphiphilic exporter-1
VVVDPARLAARRVTINELVTALDRENRNTSGGSFDEGKRRYVVRTVSEYTSPQDVEDIVVAVRNDVPVYLRDVAQARLTYERPTSKAFQEGEPILAIDAKRQPGANVPEVMVRLRKTVENLNKTLLARRGLRLINTYDETDYITSSIKLVTQSLLIGGLLAVVVLLLFLRSPTSTLVVAIAIPISMIGTFLLMHLFGRTLNVVSMAGMAFAVGMVVDNSIVVLENIYRHRQMGKRRAAAAFEGAREVWGAALASTLTTIAVFLPILFVQEEAGQLFRDIAIAIACGVGLSLLVAMTVIPSLSAKLLNAASMEGTGSSFSRLWGGISLAQRMVEGITNSVDWICATSIRRLVLILSFTGAALGLGLWLLPKAEYLPSGNRNFILAILVPPPGYNIDELASLQDPYNETLGYLWETPAEEAHDLPGGGVDEVFYVSSPQFNLVAARGREPLRVRELIPEFQAVGAQLPGTLAFVQQTSLFGRGFAGRAINIDLTGPDLNHLLDLGKKIFARVPEVIPGAQAFATPSLDLDNPEIRIRPHRRRAAELGISSRDLGLVVSALVDGVKASDYQHEGREIDLKVIAESSGNQSTHLLEQFPIATPDGRLTTLGSLASFELVNGPTSVRRLKRQRVVTIQVSPPITIPLQAVMESIENDLLDPLRDTGELGGLYRSRLSGSADKLTQTGAALKWNFALAVILTYLLLAALFENFLYPLVILFGVPLATFGGVLGLTVLNLFTYQSLDVLTMLGFIILVGTVVNNAILIVHQTLNHLRNEGLEPRAALREATRNRIRPIFMSVSTSIFGMLPLVLFPGAGSELYRGLGSVVVGGLAVSTAFTLFLVPALLSLVLEFWEKPGKKTLGEVLEGALVEQ